MKKPESITADNAILGIGGIGAFTENELPIIPSEKSLDRYEKMVDQARYCICCGQSDIFDGAMFTNDPSQDCAMIVEANMEKALKLIISKSPDAMREAIKTLQAISAKSPVVQQRYNHVVEIALNDPQAEFMADERAIMAESLVVTENEARDFTLRVRLTQGERVALQEAADEIGLDMSEYVRQKLFS